MTFTSTAVVKATDAKFNFAACSRHFAYGWTQCIYKIAPSSLTITYEIM